MEKYIYEDVTELKTPVGYFFVTDGKVKIPFSIRKSTINVPYQIYDNNNQVIDEINIETNYDLVIDVNKIKLGCYYYISFSTSESFMRFDTMKVFLFCLPLSVLYFPFSFSFSPDVFDFIS